jgi:hypothetical protein
MKSFPCGILLAVLLAFCVNCSLASVGVADRIERAVVFRNARHTGEDGDVAETDIDHDKKPNVNTTIVCGNSTGANATLCRLLKEHTASGDSFVADIEGFYDVHKGVILRALVVFGSITAIVLLYITFHYIRQRRQRNKSRKYGLITMPDDKLELRPLDEDDDDDEDMTVFDRTKPHNVNNARTNGHPGSARPLVKRTR